MDIKHFCRQKFHSGDIHGKPIARDKRIGYCWSTQHPGYLSVADVEKHQCLCKNCPGLEQFEDSGYWNQQKRKIEHKIERKESLSLQKQHKKNCQIILEIAREETKDLDDFFVIDVKKNTINNKYLVEYVSLQHIDLLPITSRIENESGCSINWKGVKNTYSKKKELLEVLKQKSN